jgi:peptide subunit release factor RF-3
MDPKHRDRLAFIKLFLELWKKQTVLSRASKENFKVLVNAFLLKRKR